MLPDELKQFLKRENIVFTDQMQTLCEEAFDLMKKSKDPVHDEQHIIRILSDLERLLYEEKLSRDDQISCDVLLLSIYWHDVWRSQYFPKSLLVLLWTELWDGIGSMTMFTQAAGKTSLDKDTLHNVRYTIRKHSTFQLLPLRTCEARILRDLDILDQWSVERLEQLKKQYLHTDRINPKLLKIAKFYFDHFMREKDERCVHFSWSKKEFLKRKKVYFDKVDALLEKYEHFL